MQITALYESVTQSIIKDLEAGVASWVKPWKDGNTGGILPMNAATKRGYNGVNIPILWHAQLASGYPTASWMTYKQAQGTPRCTVDGRHANGAVAGLNRNLQQPAACQRALIPHRQFGRQPRYTFGTMNAQIER
jgi:antirestriction protein ArdC